MDALLQRCYIDDEPAARPRMSRICRRLDDFPKGFILFRFELRPSSAVYSVGP